MDETVNKDRQNGDATNPPPYSNDDRRDHSSHDDRHRGGYNCGLSFAPFASTTVRKNLNTVEPFGIWPTLPQAGQETGPIR
jgi:hypothetical protein